ncbi:nucleotidyl transferase [mine drainage metagenome]|uniref:UTP--glucose-1-phosphate uridylyltransferase n=1 Tax=mine drainage metagenome TaxID=410659 RepID=T0ZH39_9ZZZZ
MQGLITAAGVGNRAKTGPGLRKVMLPIYDIRHGELVIRPIIDCIIERMEGLGIRDIITVLDPSDIVTIQYVKSNRAEVSIEYQKERRGFGNAILTASKSLNGKFLLNAGDGVLLDIESYRALAESHSSSTLALMRVSNPERYGVAACSSIGGRTYRIVDVEEKPLHPRSNLALAAAYVLDKGVLDYISKSGKNVELTSAIERYIASGNDVNGILLPKNQWLSVGNASDYLRVLGTTHRWALKKLGADGLVTGL